MLTDKEKMELLNLRKRVEAQREEIKKLQQELQQHKAYIREIDAIVSRAILDNDAMKESYMLLTMNT